MHITVRIPVLPFHFFQIFFCCLHDVTKRLSYTDVKLNLLLTQSSDGILCKDNGIMQIGLLIIKQNYDGCNLLDGLLSLNDR